MSSGYTHKVIDIKMYCYNGSAGRFKFNYSFVPQIEGRFGAVSKVDFFGVHQSHTRRLTRFIFHNERTHLLRQLMPLGRSDDPILILFN